MILVVGNQQDPHVRAVVSRLAEANSDAVVLDAYDEHSLGLTDSVAEGVSLALGASGIQLSTVTSIWWRQKAKPQLPADSVLGLYDYGFVQREWNTVFDYIAARTANVFSVNDRQKAKLAENKVFQLETASRHSLKVPRTIVTNRARDAVRFFEQAGVHRCVYKSFSPYMPPNLTMAYTTELDMLELSREDYQNTIDTTPGIFQELIEADFELRVTVVGGEVFSARIDPPENASGVDWRISLFENRYSPAQLPSELEAELLRFHADLGLVFAAYDFIIDRAGDIFLLEANPSGQWMWLEQQLKMPISEAIARQLQSPHR